MTSLSPGTDYGAVVRRLAQLCQQVDVLSAPVPRPASVPSATQGSDQPKTPVGTRHAPTPPKTASAIPRLVLVGGQSTGKTSLVECLAGVSLPRSQGTCTRGPLDITITASDGRAQSGSQWSAIVHLLLPASTHCSRVQFGDVIAHPDDVADRLRRATLAVRDLASLSILPRPSSDDAIPILNNSKYQLLSRAELEDAEDDSESLPTFFLKDARLSLSIRAPGVEPLRFTDLPGLISEGHSAEVTGIRNMIFRDISDANTIIVLTASFAMDLAHQNAFSVVKSVDARGDRTIGVLTMPDRMPFGAERQWSKVINESLSDRNDDSTPKGKHYLKHGWHVVRCPAQNESRGDVAFLEDQLFNHAGPTSPWGQTLAMISPDFAFARDRCGLQSLYLRLSRLLLDQTRQSLPGIIETLASVAKQHEAVFTDIGSADPAAAAGGPAFTFPKDSPLRPNPSPEISNLSNSTQGNGVGMDVTMELLKAVDALIKQLRLSPADVDKHIVPDLRHQLMALVPSYLPLTAAEAKDPKVVAAYNPRPWSFDSISGVGEDSPPWSADINAGGDDHAYHEPVSPSSGTSANQLLRRPMPKKKSVTIDDIVASLYSDESDTNAITAPALHLFDVHASLQARFRSFVHSHHSQCRLRLASLIRKSIAADLQQLYPKLCSDLLDIADRFVQSRLNTEMRRLADRVNDHGVIATSRVGNHNARGGADNGCKQWIDEERRAYLLMRASLVAKERTDERGRQFRGGLDRTIAWGTKVGLFAGDGDSKDRGGTRDVPASPGPGRVPSEAPSIIATPAKKKARATSPVPSETTDGVELLPHLLVGHRLLVPYEQEAVLELMAHLRGDFNFFALLVADECQSIPNKIMQDLQPFLRNEVLPAIRANLDEEELYNRYLYEADRPRRERSEYLGTLQTRVGAIDRLLVKLRKLSDELEGRQASTVAASTPAMTPGSGSSRTGTSGITLQSSRTLTPELPTLPQGLERSPTSPLSRYPRGATSVGGNVTPSKRRRPGGNGLGERRQAPVAREPDSPYDSDHSLDFDDLVLSQSSPPTPPTQLSQPRTPKRKEPIETIVLQSSDMEDAN